MGATPGFLPQTTTEMSTAHIQQKRRYRGQWLRKQKSWETQEVILVKSGGTRLLDGHAQPSEGSWE